MKRPVILAVAALAAAASYTVIDGGTTTSAESTCPAYTTGHLTPAGSYTAPTGYLISAVCVKAGSDIQGDGPEITNYDPPVTSVTITHSSGKDVSHFSVLLVPKTSPTTTTTENPCPDPPCIPNTNVQTTTTTQPGTTTTTTQPGITTTSSTSTPATPTTTTSPTSSTTTATGFAFGAAASVCVAEVPMIRINFLNTFPELAGQTGTLTMSDVDGNVVSTQSLVYQPGTTVDLLYPGTSVNADGSIDDVPGWILTDDGFWIRDDSDAFLREGITLTYTVNPTATATVTYPPESSTCANPDGPFPPGVTPPVPDGPAQLPPTR